MCTFGARNEDNIEALHLPRVRPPLAAPACLPGSPHPLGPLPSPPPIVPLPFSLRPSPAFAPRLDSYSNAAPTSPTARGPTARAPMAREPTAQRTVVRWSSQL